MVDPPTPRECFIFNYIQNTLFLSALYGQALTRAFFGASIKEPLGTLEQSCQPLGGSMIDQRYKTRMRPCLCIFSVTQSHSCSRIFSVAQSHRLITLYWRVIYYYYKSLKKQLVSLQIQKDEFSDWKYIRRTMESKLEGTVNSLQFVDCTLEAAKLNGEP